VRADSPPVWREIRGGAWKGQGCWCHAREKYELEGKLEGLYLEDISGGTNQAGQHGERGEGTVKEIGEERRMAAAIWRNGEFGQRSGWSGKGREEEKKENGAKGA